MNGITSSHGAKIMRLAADIAHLRLPPGDIAELRYFFNEFEADIGIHSLHFAQFDAMLGSRNTSNAASPDGIAQSAPRSAAVERLMTHRRAERRRSLVPR